MSRHHLAAVLCIALAFPMGYLAAVGLSVGWGLFLIVEAAYVCAVVVIRRTERPSRT